MASAGSDPQEKPKEKKFLERGKDKLEEGQEDQGDVRLPQEQPPSPFFETKTFRLISIFLYVGGISGLGMVLALYYLLFFDSSMPDIHLKFPVSIGGHPVQKVHEYQ